MRLKLQFWNIPSFNKHPTSLDRKVLISLIAKNFKAIARIELKRKHGDNNHAKLS